MKVITNEQGVVTVVGKGKSTTKYKFTAEDIANIIGKKKRTVQTYIKNGVFNPHDLKSVLQFCLKHIKTA